MPFRDIAGHRHLLELLVRRGRARSLPPSLIFAGPGGRRQAPRGRRAGTAPELPDARRPADGLGAATPAGLRRRARRIARGVHADVLLIEPGDTGAIKVDQIRDAIEKSAYRPFEGRRRVVIVDEADALLVEAQNALLKTLEEPPSASMFVLVTSRPDVLLPTVRSRCQRLRFGRLAPADVADGADRATTGILRAEAHAAASAADGSVGAALDGGSEDFAEARDAAAGLLQGVAASTDPRRRLDSAKMLMGARRAIGTSWRAGCGRWRRCFVTLASCFPARTSAASRMLT